MWTHKHKHKHMHTQTNTHSHKQTAYTQLASDAKEVNNCEPLLFHSLRERRRRGSSTVQEQAVSNPTASPLTHTYEYTHTHTHTHTQRHRKALCSICVCVCVCV